jgi:hypothetical protein
VHIDFLKGVDSKGSSYKVLPRNIQMHVQKAKDSDGFWPRLLKDKTLEKNQLTVDWDRYVDEDEEQDKGGFDLSNLNGGKSMPSMGMEQLVRVLEIQYSCYRIKYSGPYAVISSQPNSIYQLAPTTSSRQPDLR